MIRSFGVLLVILWLVKALGFLGNPIWKTYLESSKTLGYCGQRVQGQQ